MSNAGGLKVKAGAITGEVLRRNEPGLETVEFQPEGGFEDVTGAIGGAVTGVVKAAAGASSVAVSVATGVVSGGAAAAAAAARGAQQAAAATVAAAAAAAARGALQAAAATVAAIPKVTISVPKVEIPKIEIPKIEIPKVSISMPKVDMPKVSLPDMGKALAAIAMPTVAITTLPQVKTPTTPANVDIWSNALNEIGKVGAAAASVLTTGPVGLVAVAGKTALDMTGFNVGKTGSDFLKSLPTLEVVQKATQSLNATTFLAGITNPFTAPATIGLGAATYAMNVLAPTIKLGSVPAVATKTPEITTSMEQRMANLPVAGEVPTGGLPEDVFAKGDVWHYGENSTDIATCTIRKGAYKGFVHKYKYTESIPDECVPEGAVKYYTALGNYKQKEMVGIPRYMDNGRIEMLDPDTGIVIQDINQEEIASGTVSVGKPETSLVYQGWSTEPAVGVTGKDFDKKQSNRFAITEFRDENSADLEAQVDNLNNTEGGDYALVNYSRLGAELYGGKVLPLDGRTLDSNLVTEQTDYGKKVGLDFTANNTQKLYGDLGQATLGKTMVQKIETTINNKGAISKASEKSVTDPLSTMGTITNGFVLKKATECAEGDIICGIGRGLDVINPNSICAKDSTNPLCQGFRGVENTALQLTEGVVGAIPSLADLAYDTTTGAIEKMRGLDEGTLKRLGSRTAWDNLFESTTENVVGFDLDKQYYTKALGLDKQTAEGDLVGVGAKLGVGLFEDFLSHPVEWLSPEIMAGELILQAPSIGEGISSVVTGTPKKEVKYSYMIQDGEFVQVEEVSEETPSGGGFFNDVMEAARGAGVAARESTSGEVTYEKVRVYTDDPTKVGQKYYSTTRPVGAF